MTAPYWSSWAAFWSMGGYAPYVWGSFGMCALVFAAELVALRRHRRTLAAESGAHAAAASEADA